MDVVDLAWLLGIAVIILGGMLWLMAQAMDRQHRRLLDELAARTNHLAGRLHDVQDRLAHLERTAHGSPPAAAGSGAWRSASMN